ncbi:3-hydroxyacyl-CoA dehydratase PHS1 [Habropoda laboriosa]|uniref:Very-long-chain (3R)-3-hydroxyacyl-CoA dehydratase n=1 Tax=Habropoda laboriosa TaxID=597456 RepID=A0A0L7RHZ8_9HYME|nr:3-hydroxyacyl-CoA dehydratase PHS1 [Habropoda laboriosa]
MTTKKSSNFATSYLKGYNLAQVFGWSYILYKFITNDFSSTSEAHLWQNIKWPVIIFQHAAALEIFHTVLGLVKSNPVLTTFQVLSRVIIVSGAFLATPNNYAVSSSGMPLAILAWSITEIIRYLFYFLNLNSVFPQLYCHMVAQRRKVLGSDASKKAQ